MSDHPLLNRRDVTAARTPAQAPPPEHHPLEQLLWAQHHTNDLLGRLLEQRQADIADLCVTDRDPAQNEMCDFPVPGSKRLITRRTGQGGSYALTAGQTITLVRANEARLGGLITTTTAVVLFLTQGVDASAPATGPLSAGVPQLAVPANGAWDFKLADLLWCGHVTVYAPAAGTVLVAEV